jgi:hypothetical protein
MLKKEICLRCYIEKLKHGDVVKARYDFEKRWDEDVCWCPFEKRVKIVEDTDYVIQTYQPLKIEDIPPENCPYALEHIVNRPSL